jgi:hypothetical protein
MRLLWFFRLPAVRRGSSLAALQFLGTRLRFRLRRAVLHPVGRPLLARRRALGIPGRGLDGRGLSAGTFIALLRHIRWRLRDNRAGAD